MIALYDTKYHGKVVELFISIYLFYVQPEEKAIKGERNVSKPWHFVMFCDIYLAFDITGTWKRPHVCFTPSSQYEHATINIVIFCV